MSCELLSRCPSAPDIAAFGTTEETPGGEEEEPRKFFLQTPSSERRQELDLYDDLRWSQPELATRRSGDSEASEGVFVSLWSLRRSFHTWPYFSQTQSA